jgi:mannose-6-phosphate isomerase-like protein (cupin superfamily)
VAGLNEITVLIDRSLTACTEVGLNSWVPGQNGPPHRHEAKEQIFFVTAGTGAVRVGDETFRVQPKDFIYVPAGVEHQSIAAGPGPLQYLLFNAFLDADKEGHATFAAHIAAVKHIRRAQADRQDSGAGGGEKKAPSRATRRGKHIRDIFGVKTYDVGSNTAHLLLDRAETARCEATIVSWPAGSKGATVSHSEKEQTFFVLEGSGKVTVDGETAPVTVGDVVFVPWKAPHTTEAGAAAPLVYLCLNAIVTEEREASFQAMYDRVAAGRIARWKRGDGRNQVNERRNGMSHTVKITGTKRALSKGGERSHGMNLTRKTMDRWWALILRRRFTPIRRGSRSCPMAMCWLSGTVAMGKRRQSSGLCRPGCAMAPRSSTCRNCSSK